MPAERRLYRPLGSGHPVDPKGAAGSRSLTDPDPAVLHNPQGPFATGDAGDGHRRLFTTLPVPALVIDSLGFIRQANRPASEFLGLALHAGLQQRSILQFLSPDARQRLLWRLADRSGQEVYEIRGVELRGALERDMPCDLHLVQLEGSVTLMPMSLLVIVDRSLEAELRHSEQQLRRQSQRLADVIWASQSGTFEWDLQTGTLLVNDRLAEIVGHSPREFEHLTTAAWMDLFHPDDRLRVDALVQRPRAAGTNDFDLRLRMAHRSGGWIWVLCRGRAMDWNDHDRPVRMVGTILDISGEVEREHLLKAAKEQAETTARMKTQWLAQVSHEIRTPLNSVLGLLQLTQEWAVDERQRDAWRRVMDSAQLLNQTVEDMLDNARLESEQLALEVVRIETHELATSIMSMFAHRAQESGLRLTCTLAPQVPRVVLGDPLRLRQIINNLVNNALKFTTQGEVRVNLGGPDEPQGLHYPLRVDIWDTGPGISPEHLPHLFTPYYQADVSHPRRYGGSGLGLSIVRRLVDLMHGQLGVQSEVGRGSHFWFTVHLEREVLTAEPDGKPFLRWNSDQVQVTQPLSAAWLPDSDVQDREPTPTPESMWIDLKQALVIQDYGAVDLCHQLIPNVSENAALMLRRVLRHVREFDFESALGELRLPGQDDLS